MTMAAAYWILIVSFARGDLGGLYLAQLDVESQTLSHVQHITEGVNRPIFARFSDDGRQLFVVDTDGGDRATGFGALAVFSFDAEIGRLTLQGRVSTQGRTPCYVGLTGRLALVANYSQGNVAAIAYDQTGPLGEATTFAHTGSSLHPRRQTEPHPHAITASPDGAFALAADLGADQVVIYRLGPDAVVQPTPNRIAMEPGSGPRHLAFSADAKRLFVVNEIANTLCSFAWDAEAGRATPLDCVSVLPADFSGTNHAADIATHPRGPLVYSSNRGHDTIAVFAHDEQGKLTLKAHLPSAGRTPTALAITRDARFMLVANRDEGNVVLFSLDEQAGIPARAGQPLTMPSPTWVTTLPKR